MPTRGTTYRSPMGKKLYAVRDAKGKFKDSQSHERSQRQDMKRKSNVGRGKKK